MTDIIIIGAGPAGLTAGIYAKRSGKSVLIFEKSAPGGQIINSPNIENYPGFKNISGPEFATSLYNQAKDLGAEFIFDEVIKIESQDKKKIVCTKDKKYEAKRIIIATGCANKKLGLPNEDKLIGNGISYCATCDGAFYKEKSVAVIGGGNTATMDALFLANYCKKVYVLCRSHLKSDESEQEKLKQKQNVEIINNTIVTKLIGDNKLESIEVKTGDKVSNLDVDAVFVAIGQEPQTKGFENILELDKFGYAKTNEECMTKEKGIFVAGDVREKHVRQLTTATADGTIASINASKE